MNNYNFFGSFGNESDDSFEGFGNFSFGRGRGGPRMGHGNVTPNVLKALEEKPMYGYEIIQHFERKSHGLWRPSAGSIYPVLQSLEEQELVKSYDVNGKRVYELTDAGREQLKKFPWGHSRGNFEHHAKRGKQFKDLLRESGRELFDNLRQIGVHGTDEDLNKVKEIVKRAADELSTLVKDINTRNEDTPHGF